MTVLLAVLISGVLLDSKDVPMAKHHLAFTSADGKFMKATTDKDGKFSVDLAEGTYRFQVDSDGTYYPGTYYPELEKAQTITVDKTTSELKLKLKPPLQPEPHVIEVIQGTRRGDFNLPLGPRG